MISNLPWDVVEEILSRVPVTSLRRLRSTCKGWYHHPLFKDPGFIKKHLDKTERQYNDVLLIEFKVYSLSSNLNGIHVNSRLLFEEGKLSLIDPLCNSSELNIYEAFHCDGLLLCTTISIRHGYRCVVWNPFSGKNRWIRPINQYHKRSDEVYALGYNNKELCHSYKILRFIDRKTLEMYEFSSNSWRNFDVSPLGDLVSRGVSLKGNTYWVSIPFGGNDYSLLSFDFSTEKFQHLCVPLHEVAATLTSNIALSVVREEHLSLLLYQVRQKGKMEIWIAKEIETTLVSWSKFLTVDLKPHMIRRITHPISFFIDEEKKVAVYYERDMKEHNKVCIVGEDEYQVDLTCSYLKFWRRKCWPTVFTHVPRLV